MESSPLHQRTRAMEDCWSESVRLPQDSGLGVNVRPSDLLSATPAGFLPTKYGAPEPILGD